MGNHNHEREQTLGTCSGKGEPGEQQNQKHFRVIPRHYRKQAYGREVAPERRAVLAVVLEMPSGVSVYEAVDDGEDFVFRDYNAAAEKIDRISRVKVVGKRVTQAFPGVKGFGLFEVFQRVWRTGQMEYFPAALYKDDRHQGAWRENWVYKLPNGNIVAVFNDITEHKKTEAEVLWLASFPALNPNPIVEVDLEGNIS